MPLDIGSVKGLLCVVQNIMDKKGLVERSNTIWYNINVNSEVRAGVFESLRARRVSAWKVTGSINERN
jgi:hypothetical protein